MDLDAESEPHHRNNLTESITIPSDSESYAANNELSSSPPSSSSSPVILYSPPTIWSILRGAAINLILPFVNGLMLGFGELLAHEAAFRLGWGGTKFSRIATGKLASRQQLVFHRHTGCLQSSWRPRLTSFELPRISPLSSARSQSTVAGVPNAPVDAAASEAVLGDTFESALESATRLSTEELASIPAIPDQIGYLKALGLDFGWGPTSVMQWVLEHIHVWTGAPWWLSIALTAVFLRAVFFKAGVQAADTSGRMTAMKPATQSLMDQMRAAQRDRDTVAIFRIKGEMTGIYARAGIKPMRAFLPALQIPFGFGSYRLLRNMAALPVPGLDTGGVLWLRDLTVPDPFFALPMVTGLMLYRNMKASGDMMGNTMLSTTMMRALTYGLPVLTTCVMLSWPAAVQMTFFVSMVLAFLQSWAFRQPRFRRWVGIVPLPRPAPSGNSTRTPSAYPGKLNLSTRYQAPTLTTAENMPKPEGVVDGAIAEVRGMGVEIQKTWRKFRGDAGTGKPGDRTEAEKRQAAAYEKKRQKEIMQQRREREQSKREMWWQKQERQERSVDDDDEEIKKLK